MLVRDLIWKVLSVVFAFCFTQFSIWSNNYTTTRLTETFKPLLGWIKNIDYETSFEKAKEMVFCYSCSNNRYGNSSNNELDINNLHPRLQEKVDVPGIIYQQVSVAPPSRPPKCTWKQRLGFQFPSSRSPPIAPSVWNFVSVIASHWLDTASGYAKWFRLRLVRCSFMKRCEHFIRSYLPWEPNPVLELLAIWTVFSVFIIGLNLYDIMIFRSKEQDGYDDGQNDSEECKACMEEKMRVIFPQIKLLDEG